MSEKIDQAAKLIYGAIKGWQDGVMADLDEWDQAVAEGSAVVDIAYETAEAVLAALSPTPPG